jgi:hypothetical protein
LVSSLSFLISPKDPPVPPSSHRLWTLANILSIGRLLLLWPLFVYLRQGKDANWYAMAVMGAALLTDMLDGLIARHFHQESDWGKVLDPLADKVWIGCLAVFLAVARPAAPLVFSRAADHPQRPQSGRRLARLQAHRSDPHLQRIRQGHHGL